jgi:DNA invertase Pin-like site-specific DNA recombinase
VIVWLRRSREPNGAVRGKLSGTYSPTGEGKFFFTMMAAFAELERDIIHERTMAGLAAAGAGRDDDRSVRRHARRGSCLARM